MRICPFCGEGPIYEAKVKCTQEIIYICAECDTVWKKNNDEFEATNFSDYMKKRKQAALWTNIELLRAV